MGLSAHRDCARHPGDWTEYRGITNRTEISSELKRFRELIAKNREERLRLAKNLDKVTRQIGRTAARAKTALHQAQNSSPKKTGDFRALYGRLAEALLAVESRNLTAQKCRDRLTIRCQSCAVRDLTPQEHATQLDGVRFEYLLLLKAQGLDEAQLEKYGAIEEHIAQLSAGIQA